MNFANNSGKVLGTAEHTKSLLQRTPSWTLLAGRNCKTFNQARLLYLASAQPGIGLKKLLNYQSQTNGVVTGCNRCRAFYPFVLFLCHTVSQETAGGTSALSG